MQRVLRYTTDNDVLVRDILKMNGFSSHILTRLKHTEGSICINGNIPVYLNHILQPGEVLSVYINDYESSKNIIPVHMPLNIIYEDEDVLIINKPADMPIHPSINNHDNTLANGVIDYFNSKNVEYVFRCINRLDRDTSGLTLLANNPLSSAILSDMKLKNKIYKEYYAICEGIMPENGTISAKIARKDGSTIERCIDEENGDIAITHYKRLAFIPSSTNAKNGLSLARINLDTGRTHQIRVHFKSMGHPLIGDFLYNPDFSIIKRQALHCGLIEFNHPVTNKKIQVKAPLPSDMQEIFPDYLI